MYHNIATLPQGVKKRGLYVSPTTFARQMGLLRTLGFRGLSMSDAMPYLTGRRAGRIAVLTLDDGYADNLESAAPTLQRHGFTATCYAVSGRVGDQNTWDGENENIHKPIMSAAQLQAWHAAGMEVGAHTRSHVRLTQCDDTQVNEEIKGSKADLETILGTTVSQFCYPYGDYNDRVVKAVRDAGFSAATTTVRGRADVESDMDLWRLPRVKIARNHFLPQVLVKLVTSYEEGRG